MNWNDAIEKLYALIKQQRKLKNSSAYLHRKLYPLRNRFLKGERTETLHIEILEVIK